MAAVLCQTDHNLAAGMNSGIDYVYYPALDFISRCNLGTIELERVETPDDLADLMNLVEQHRQFTDSMVAEKVLAQWPEVTAQFVKVMPVDYKRVLADRSKHDEEVESGVHGVPSHG